jgi:L-lactate dehydrogenase
MGSQFDINSLDGVVLDTHRPIHAAKIGIIGGAGAVGAATALQLAHSGLATELVIVDVFHLKAHSVALDIADAALFTNPCRITAGDYADLAGANIVIVTAGFAQQPGETRLDLVAKNFALFKKIIPSVVRHAPGCVLLVATNPVDVLTYAALRISGFPPGRVIGSGTVLDTARLRVRLGRAFGVSPSAVNTLIVGEHGDSEVAVRSHTNVGCIRIEDLRDAAEHAKWDHCVEETVQAALRIQEGKGFTDCGIGASLTAICRAVLRDEGMVMPVSILGDYAGVADVCLSVPNLVGAKGAVPVGVLRLDKGEEEGLRRSALRIREVIGSLQF